MTEQQDDLPRGIKYALAFAIPIDSLYCSPDGSSLKQSLVYPESCSKQNKYIGGKYEAEQIVRGGLNNNPANKVNTP